ncbi:hypothetical protein [Orrella sp. 11846]|uniref:hypothetical protein n=1 Tax=Orrella sp. 11846 TaxID=3409913 RepID=UPI003B5A1C9F
MNDQIEVQALKFFKFGNRIVSPKTGMFVMTKRQFTAHEAAGLVREVRPTPDRGENSSASPAVPALSKQTAKKSVSGVTKARKTVSSSSRTQPTE